MQYMILLEGSTKAPTYVHDRFIEADYEAHRLAQKFNAKATILAIVATV